MFERNDCQHTNLKCMKCLREYPRSSISPPSRKYDEELVEMWTIEVLRGNTQLGFADWIHLENHS